MDSKIRGSKTANDVIGQDPTRRLQIAPKAAKEEILGAAFQATSNKPR
jgi:hypothetical protein